MKKIILLPLLFIATLFISACSGPTDSPESATKHFIESTYKGDSKALIESLDLGKDGEDKNVKGMVEGKMNMAAQEAKTQSEANGGVDSIKINDVTYTNSDKTKATVSFTVKFKKNNADDVGTINTNKTDKGWKIAL